MLFVMMINSLAGRICVRQIAVLLLAVLPASGLVAQTLGLSGEPAKNAAIVKLFGGNTAFSARAEFRILDRNQKETDFMPVNYACLDGDVRMEIDMNQVKSVEEPALAPTALKQMSMDQTIIITRPEKKLTYSIFPRAKAYAEIPMNKDETAAMQINFKVASTPLGKETVDGHPCQKQKVTLTGDNGAKEEATVWNATDLKDFPVQIQMVADTSSILTVKFRDVKLGKPDAKQFEPAADLKKYDSVEALRDALIKVATTAAKK